MENKKGKLIFFSGKMGAGKSTMSKEISLEEGTVLISEDEWLSNMYPEEIKNFDDYVKYSIRIKPLLKKHIVKLLNNGLVVILDFPGNTKRQRSWFKSIIEESDDFNHELIYLKASNELCLRHIEKRRLSNPERNGFDTKETFEHVTSFFEEPSDEEGFNIKIIAKK
ncbi:MAG: ATP-binding protein [Acholeplasma sp.]|nr:ATP-binding protein [Acholeplasma sp.]